MRFRNFAAIGLLAALASSSFADFELTVLHQNDTHARLDATMIRGKPYGGFARVATLMKQERAKAKNVLTLHGGDAFQGTLYFNVYEGLADLACMNAIGYTAMAVGNHEFDRGPKTLGAFARGATFPLLAANLDVSAEPELKEFIKPSIVVQIGGQKVGVVGMVTDTLFEISSPGPNVKMLDLKASVQSAVDALAKQGVNKIILVSHCGFGEEQALAKELRGVDAIVGGHSHTLIGTATADGFPRSNGAYPTVVKNADGDTALVVQAWEWGKVVGRLNMVFDDKGRVKSWAGSTTIVVDESIPEDPLVKSIVKAFEKPIIQLRDQKVATTASAISRSGQQMGEVIADAQLAATQKNGTVLALMNPGGIRADIDAGDITYGEAIAVQPFNNTLVVLDLTGAEIQAVLEQLLNRAESGYLRISKGSSYRVIRGENGPANVVEITVAGVPLDPAKTYRVVTNNFLANGGDGLTVLKDAKGYRYDTGMLDVDALIDYLKSNPSLNLTVENRIKF